MQICAGAERFAALLAMQVAESERIMTRRAPWHVRCDPAAMHSIHGSPESSWFAARERLRTRFSGLTDEDLTFVPGREETLMEAVARKTGRSRQELVDAFDAAGMFRVS